MKYSADDVHRSLRRYIAAALTDWEVWTQRDEIRDSMRPVAVVEPSSPTTTTFARATVPQGDIARVRGFSIQCYPELGDTARDSRLLAQQIEELLNDAITFGLREEDTRIGGPRKIPVYDYSGVALAGNAAARRGPATPYGYLDVADGWAANTIQDPIDPLRFTVTLDIRVSWWASGVIADEPVAQSMDGTGTFA